MSRAMKTSVLVPILLHTGIQDVKSDVRVPLLGSSNEFYIIRKMEDKASYECNQIGVTMLTIIADSIKSVFEIVI